MGFGNQDSLPHNLDSNLMKVNLEQPQINERAGVVNRGKTVLGPLKKESVMLDANGNQIDRRTKQIIKLAEI